LPPLECSIILADLASGVEDIPGLNLNGDGEAIENREGKVESMGEASGQSIVRLIESVTFRRKRIDGRGTPISIPCTRTCDVLTRREMGDLVSRRYA